MVVFEDDFGGAMMVQKTVHKPVHFAPCILLMLIYLVQVGFQNMKIDSIWGDTEKFLPDLAPRIYC